MGSREDRGARRGASGLIMSNPETRRARGLEPIGTLVGLVLRRVEEANKALSTRPQGSAEPKKNEPGDGAQ